MVGRQVTPPGSATINAADPAAFETVGHSWSNRGGHRGNAGSVPAGLADLMSGLAGGATVLDPFCHDGELLRAAGRGDPQGVVLCGQHPDPQQAHQAASALWPHLGRPPRIEVGDGLRADAFGGEGFESVVCVPPWGSKDWGFEDLRFDPRWEYGLPPRPAGELAWVQHALAHLDPEGVAVLALPAASGTQARGRRIRTELIRRGALRAVIALPRETFPANSTPTVLWVLRNPSSQVAAPGRVLMVDGSAVNSARGQHRPDPAEPALTAWREFDSTGDCVQRPGGCRAVPAIELLDGEVNLTPARHVGVATETDVAGIRLDRGRTLELLAELPDMVPDVAAGSGAAGAGTTIGELARLGAVRVLQHNGSSSRREQEGMLPALTPRDVLKGRAPSGFGGRTGTREPVWLRPGDVVLPMLGGRATSRVIEEEEAVLGANLWLLRVDPEQLDPWFLAGFLRNPANSTPAAASVSMAARLDVAQVQLPRLPLSEQRDYAAAFRRLFTLERALRRARRNGDELITAMIDGLTDNDLHPAGRQPR